MDIVPLAAESLGTRSMATWVTISSRNFNLLIDPGVLVGEKRFGLKPHIKEIERNLDHWNIISAHLSKSNYVVISHYHYDHYNPRIPQLFKDKVLFLKNPRPNNRNQEQRAKIFLEKIKGLSSKVYHSDWRTFDLDEGIQLSFSGALPHGPEGAKTGYVVATTIKFSNKVFTHTSDVLGIQSEVQLNYILEQNPTILYIDGPSTGRGKKTEIKKSVVSLNVILSKTEVKEIIYDHHMLRNLNWIKYLVEFIKHSEHMGVKTYTAAEFLGKKNDLLEANRKLLYENQKDL